MSVTMSGWAAPRWVTWLLLGLGAAQTAVSALTDFHVSFHGQDLTAYVNMVLAAAAQFSHSMSLGGIRLPPWFGAVATFLSMLAATTLPQPLGSIVAFLALWATTISRSVTNVAPNPAPESPMAVMVTSATAKAEVR